MNENTPLLETILLIVGLFVLLWVLWCVLIGAIILLKRACASGVGHVILYFAGWTIIAPIMAIWSFFVGVVA